jgi:hypothetical protein
LLLLLFILFEVVWVSLTLRSRTRFSWHWLCEFYLLRSRETFVFAKWWCPILLLEGLFTLSSYLLFERQGPRVFEYEAV